VTTNKQPVTLIVGQGLAGTLLAWQLIRLGQQVIIVDREELVTSSKIAGGIITPITGMRMVKSWRLDEFYPVAKEFYRWVESETGSSLYFEKPIQRLFQSAEEQELYDQRSKEPGFADYVLTPGIPEKTGLNISSGGFVMNGGHLDVGRFLQSSRQRFIEQGCYLSGKVNPDSIEIRPDGLRWQDVTMDLVVFCEGWTNQQNPFFDWVPFKPAKGEVLEIRCDGLSQQRIINRGGFIAPLGNRKFRSGSTYEWEQLDKHPTEAGRNEICKKIEGMTDLPYEITDHKAAVRPVINESKALLGRHPSKERLAFFNGLGSKGVLNGPYLSAMLANNITKNEPLEECVDLRKNF